MVNDYERTTVEAALQAMVRNCQQCSMSRTRRSTVFYRGHKNPMILFVGEAPGKYEDMKGLPFVGPSGRLLDKEIIAAGLGDVSVGMANVVKCRPVDPGGNNRTPSEQEVAACLPFIKQQIDLLGPRVVVAVGKVAKQALNGYSPTYVLHPAAALRNPDLLDILRAHLRKVKEELNKSRR